MDSQTQMSAFQKNKDFQRDMKKYGSKRWTGYYISLVCSFR